MSFLRKVYPNDNEKFYKKQDILRTLRFASSFLDRPFLGATLKACRFKPKNLIRNPHFVDEYGTLLKINQFYKNIELIFNHENPEYITDHLRFSKVENIIKESTHFCVFDMKPMIATVFIGDDSYFRSYITYNNIKLKNVPPVIFGLENLELIFSKDDNSSWDLTKEINPFFCSEKFACALHPITDEELTKKIIMTGVT